MPNPLKSILHVRREELPIALLMSGYFFLVITSFWILKPLKSALFIEFYDESGFDFLSFHLLAAQAELLAKVLNLFVAMVAVMVFTWLARRFRRQKLSYIFCAFFMTCYVVYSFAVDAPAAPTVWSFYLFGDLFTTLMVTTFFAFLNDSVTPDAAKRLYGPIVLGGVMGGAFGPTFLRVWIEYLPSSAWLWICFVLAAVIIVVARLAGGLVVRTAPPVEPVAEGSKRGHVALEGAKLVFRSRYLLAIVAIVGLYEITSQVLDFQFKATIAHYLDGPDIGKQMTLVYAISNWVSMLVQFFLTSLVMTRAGLTVALLVLPTAIACGSVGFLALPILWAGSLLNTADSGFAYSINQSAKEALYVPTSKDEKYKAKAFIDMFVQRFAKVVAIGVSLAATTYFADFSTTRWLSVFTLIVVSIWVVAARYAGRHFNALTGKESDAPK